MKLQTNISLLPERDQIDYESKVLLLGSCFSENIGDKLEYFKFQNLQNPFGIIFNPVSIGKLIDRALTNRLFSEEDVFESKGLYHCFEVHSLVSAPKKSNLVGLLNEHLGQLREALFQSSHIVITLGTGWVYRHKSTSTIVANCHKISQYEFEKELLSVPKISEIIKEISASILKVNAKAHCVFTVSPVRHIKDGFVENTQGKAHLLAGLHQGIATASNSGYFPSYEIVMDELRDYRFYSKDMVHPNETAIDIIWERFNEVWVAKETAELQKEIDGIQRGLQHRPFHPNSDEHQRFQLKLQEKIRILQSNMPHISFK
ncbi:MAG: GSCFA domain-containing protein [Bacteroidetes bacterium]|nr:GSCFA domain-containing protein [Bacteroidota bacterium]